MNECGRLKSISTVNRQTARIFRDAGRLFWGRGANSRAAKDDKGEEDGFLHPIP
jgi:hypothetical protein